MAAELHAMGFRQVVFPGLLLTRAVHAVDVALRELRGHAEGRAPMPAFGGAASAQAALQEALRMERWRALGAGAAG